MFAVCGSTSPLTNQDALSRVAEGQAMKPEVEQFNLAESLVRGHLRDIPRQVRCADCLARELSPTSQRRRADLGRSGGTSTPVRGRPLRLRRHWAHVLLR